MKRLIKTQAEVEELIHQLGFLPMFRNTLPGFSIEEMADPSLWFNPVEDGPWEWKGPIIRKQQCAYGKFFGGKACYVSMPLLADFLNVRRATARPSAETDEFGLSQAEILRMVEELESVRSDELKNALGLMRRRKRTASDLVDTLSVTLDTSDMSKGRSRVDKLLSDLMMLGRIVISDFEYLRSRSGKRYGWGLACYTTPEAFFGREAIDPQGRTPEESAAILLDRLMPAVISTTGKNVSPARVRGLFGI